MAGVIHKESDLHKLHLELLAEKPVEQVQEQEKPVEDKIVNIPVRKTKTN
jgi:hypothetical protein